MYRNLLDRFWGGWRFENFSLRRADFLPKTAFLALRGIILGEIRKLSKVGSTKTYNIILSRVEVGTNTYLLDSGVGTTRMMSCNIFLKVSTNNFSAAHDFLLFFIK